MGKSIAVERVWNLSNEAKLETRHGEKREKESKVDRNPFLDLSNIVLPVSLSNVYTIEDKITKMERGSSSILPPIFLDCFVC